MFGKIGPKMHKKITAQMESADAREESFLGKQYLVVPVVAMVEGVRHGANAENGELGLKEEFGKFPMGWDGRPLVVNHPKVDDEFVSANSPEVLEQYSFGMTSNTVLDGSKLKMEAWINLERASEVMGAQEFVDRIKANSIVEVSVGFFTDLEDSSGEFDGKAYSGIWRNIVPDHLALLPEGIVGACSVEDGCGLPRINQEKEINMPLKVDNSNDSCCEACANKKNEENVQNHSSGEERLLSQIIAQAIPDQVLDTDISAALRDKLQENYSQGSYLIGFTTTHAIFESYDESSMQWSTKKIAFEMDGDGNVSMPTPPEKVSLITRIVTKTESSGIDNQSKYDGENQESDDSKTNSDETNETEKTMSDEDMKDQSEDENPETQAEEEETKNQTEDEETKNQAEDEEVKDQAEDEDMPKANSCKSLSVNEYISNAPTEMQEMLKSGLKMHTQRKTQIIQTLKDSGRCNFGDDYLQAQSLETLENLADLAAVPTYKGRAVPEPEVQSTDAVPSAPVAFPVK